jgi:hypothetical protein
MVGLCSWAIDMMQTMAAWSRRWGWTSLLVAMGVALRVLFVHWHPGVAGDSLLYGDLAQNMLTHHVYGFTEAGSIRPTLIRLPGYPAFLAVCFAMFGAGNFVAAVWVQVIVDLVSWWMLSRLAAHMWGERAAVAALALGMLCPFTANYCAVPLTETLVMFCVVAAMVGLERWLAVLPAGRGGNVWLAVIGVSLVYGIFLRPDQGLLAVAVIAAMAWASLKARGRRGLVPVIAMCLSMSLPFVLWGTRNWSVFHVVQPLAPRFANDPGEANPHGFQRWYRTWAIDFKATVDFYWAWDGATVSMSDLPPRAIDNEAQRAETARLFALYAQTNSSSPVLDAGMGALADERIHAHPLRYYIWVPAAKVADMWLRPRTEFMNLPLDWWNFRAHERGSWACVGLALWNAVYLALAVVGFARWRRLGWDTMLSVMAVFVAMRCALLWTIDNSEMRYTLECFPMVILLGAMALSRRNAGQLTDR